MKKYQLKVAIIAMSILFFANAKAQTAASSTTENSATVWKRNVYRTISIKDTIDYTKKRLKPIPNQLNLANLLFDLVRTGKIVAYLPNEEPFTAMVTKNYIMNIVNGKTDTVKVYDPISDMYSIKISHTDFDYFGIKDFKIYEEWTYDKNIGKTSIQIIGIAPMRDIYGDDGSYRTTAPIIWVKYKDVKESLIKYEQENPENNLMLNIWKDYFDDNSNLKLK